VCSDRAPDTTASAAAADAPTAISRSQGPGPALGTDGLLLESSTQVSQGPRTAHVGNLVEVIRRRRRARVPLEGVRHPWVVSGAPADPRRSNDVDQEEERSERHHEGADRGDEVPRGPPALVVVRVDARRHPEQPEEVWREEGQVDADEVQPEVDLAQPLVEEAAENLRPPVVQAGDGGETR